MSAMSCNDSMLGGIDLKGDDADLFSDGPDENQPAADKVQPAADEVQLAADEVQSVDKPADDDASPTVSASPIVVPTSPQISETLINMAIDLRPSLVADGVRGDGNCLFRSVARLVTPAKTFE